MALARLLLDVFSSNNVFDDMMRGLVTDLRDVPPARVHGLRQLVIADLSDMHPIVVDGCLDGPYGLATPAVPGNEIYSNRFK